MTDEVTSNPSVSEQIGFSPLGEVFYTARSAKKLSLKDVSNNLRLSIRQIEALESNDFVALPQPMITRGFIRNYARLLELDAGPLLESYRARTPDTLPGALSVQTSMHQVMLSKNSQPWLKYILGSILVILFLLTWFFYIEYMPKPVKPPVESVADVAIKNVESTFVPLPEIALPVAERQPEGVETVSTEAVIENANVAPVIPDAKEQVAKEAVIAGKTNVTDAPKPNNAILISKNVSLSVSEETWVQVTDKSGAVIYEKMMAANSTDGFDGQPPFNLLIGNANATTLTFLGKPVDLASKTKNNVARITLE
jgi:cytoskeleton protein RodZ